MKLDMEQAAKLLSECETLAQADKHLLGLMPIPNIATRWGLWDGWSGRPQSIAGIVSEVTQKLQPKVFDAAVKDYREAFEIGRRLSMAELPA